MYLEKETGYEYDVDSLKDLYFASELDIFFYKNCVIYDQYLYDAQPPRKEVNSELISPPPLYVVSKANIIDGIFLLKDVFFNEESDNFVKFNAEVVVEKVLTQKDILFDEENTYKYSQGDVGYLSNAEFNDLHFLLDCHMDTKPLRDRALTSISYSELKFKKTQLDRLISNSKPKFLELECEFEQVKRELEDASGIIEKYQKEIDRLNAQKTQLDNSKLRLHEQNEKSYLTTIGLLLELLTTPKTSDGKVLYPSEAMIIDKIVGKDVNGQKKTTLGKRFKMAKDAIIDAKKE